MAGFRLSTEPIIFLYYSIVYINYTLLPQLLLKKLCLRQSSFNITSCEDGNISEDIHKDASRWWFYILLSVQLPSIFTVLICGPITDMIGRLKGLLIIPLIDAIGSFIFLLNAYFIGGHPAFLIPGYLMISLFGEAQGVICLCMAFVADITKDARDHRTPQMALAEASLHLSGVFGGFLASLLLKEIGFLAVFLFSILIDTLILLYTWCYLSKFEKDGSSSPETVRLIPKRSNGGEEEDENDLLMENRDDSNDEQENRRSREAVDNKLSYVRSYFKQMKGIVNVMRERKVVVLMIIAFMLIFFGVLGEQLIQALYLKNQPISFSTMMVGYYVAIQGSSRFIGTVIISQISFHCLRCNDYGLMVVGGLSQMLSYIFIGLSKSTVEVFLANAASFALPLSMMSIRSVLTKKVPSNNYATVLAILASLNVLSGMISNIISSWTHQMTLAHSAGAVYFGLAVFTATAVVIIIGTYVTIERPRRDDNSS